MGGQTTNEDETGLEGESAEQVAELTETDGEPIKGDVARPHQRPGGLRNARRRWARLNTERATAVTIPSRLLILRYALWYWSAGNWEVEDAEPARLVGTLLRSVDRTGTPSQLQQRIGGLASVALLFFRRRTDLSSHNEQAMIFRRLVDDVGHLVLVVDEEAIGEYIARLVTPLGRSLDVDEVTDFIRGIVEDDPLAEIASSLEDEGHDVHHPAPRHLHLTGTFSNPEPVALRAAGSAEDTGKVAVWASNDRADWTLVAWSKPDLVTVIKKGNRPVRWRHQRLPSFMGPAAVARDYSPQESMSHQVMATPRHQPTDACRAVLADIGITAPEPPES